MLSQVERGSHQNVWIVGSAMWCVLRLSTSTNNSMRHKNRFSLVQRLNRTEVQRDREKPNKSREEFQLISFSFHWQGWIASHDNSFGLVFLSKIRACNRRMRANKTTREQVRGFLTDKRARHKNKKVVVWDWMNHLYKKKLFDTNVSCHGRIQFFYLCENMKHNRTSWCGWYGEVAVSIFLLRFFSIYVDWIFIP